MRVIRHSYILFGLALIAALAISPASAATRKVTKKHTTGKATVHKASTHKTASRRSSKSHYRRTAKKSWKSKGQHTISSDRTRQIQEALVRIHYLDGEPTGKWDSRTEAALRKFQGDQGWQTKVLPDSRALIKLGLGPDRSDVLNPETAATSPIKPMPALVSTSSEKTEKTSVTTIAPTATVIRAQ